MSLSETFLVSPLSVPGCQLWIDIPDSTTTSLGGNLTYVKDKANNVTVSLSGTAPTYSSNLINNIPGITFGGASWLRGNFSSTYTGNNLTVFAIGSLNSATAIYGRLVSFSVPGLQDYTEASRVIPILRRLQTSTVGSFRNPANDLGGQSVSYLTTYMFCAEFTGSSNNFYLNANTPSSVSNSGNFNISNWGIGYLADYGGTNDAAYWQGTFGECIVYFGSLTTANRQKIEGYLAWKWGLTSSLPSTHPFKNSRPLNGIPLPTSLLVPRRPLNNIAYSLFRPTNIGNCSLWLDAADVSTMFQNTSGTVPVRSSGSTVSLWRDKSVSSNHASNTTAQPTVTFAARNGFNVMNFSGSQYLTLSTTTLPTGSTQCSFFFVTRTTSSGVQVFFTYGANPNNTNQNPQFYYATNTLSTDTYGAGGLSDNTNYLNSYVMTSCTFTNSNIAWDNGSQFSGGSTAITLNTGTGWASIGVGRVVSTLQYYLTGQIGEIIVFNRALSAIERQTVEGYLAWKWGVQGNFPSTHPFRLNPPDLPAEAPTAVAQVKSAVFNPKNISGCGVWLDATDVNANGTTVRNGTTVSTWTDKSGNGRNASAVVAATYVSTSSGNALSFTGTNYYSFSQWSFVVNSYFTIFIVERLQASTNQHHILGSDTAGTNINLHVRYNDVTTDGSLFRFAFYSNDLDATNIPAFTTAAAQPTRVWSLVFTRSFRGIYLNGTLMASDTNNTFLTAWSTPLLGTSFVSFGGARTYNGFLYEIIGYGGQIPSSQRQQIEGYLAWKWGLQGNLPSTHPFKLFPPSP